MSHLSFMEKLLDLSAEQAGRVDVEWKAFGDVGDFVRGKRFVKTDLVSAGTSCIHYGEMYTHYGIWAKKSKSFVDAKLASKLRVANHGDVIIVAAGETIEDIGNGTAWLGEDDVVIHDACFSYKSKLNPKYVSYFLRTTLFKEQIKKYVSSGKISSINSSGLSKAKIPIPCPENPEKSLEIQAEIVRILDAFTALTAELTAELNTRKKQYNYYRDQLLSFEEGVPLLPLSQCCESIADGDHQAPQKTENGIPFITISDVSATNLIDFNNTKFVSDSYYDGLDSKRKARTNDNGFQNYYRDLAKQVKAKEIDLLIVVGMFLTGFDAPTLNTLFVDKNLRYHGLMQAYSRTNRIYDATKTFGNIVTFRDLERATIDAITLFGDKNTKNVVLEKSYKDYMEGFTDVVTGEARRGFVDVVRELEQRFPDPSAIEKESDKKAFAKLFGEYLRVENVLQNYDEFASLKALQSVDISNPEAVEAFKAKHYLNDDDLATLQAIQIPAERKIQDYRSTYNDIRDWLRREKSAAENEKSTIDWDDVVFEVDLLKSQEINLDYILELIFENNKKVKDKAALVEDVRRVIRASLGNRAKESLLVDFINQTDLDKIGDKASVIDAFFTFAQAEQQREAQELISSESLNAEAARRYIATSLKREFASDNGTELNAILPKMSPLNPQYLSKKQSVFQKIAAFVEKFKGVGGNV